MNEPLVRILDASDKSLTEISSVLKIDRRTIYNWRQGITWPSLLEVKELADTLYISFPAFCMALIGDETSINSCLYEMSVKNTLNTPLLDS